MSVPLHFLFKSVFDPCSIRGRTLVPVDVGLPCVNVDILAPRDVGYGMAAQ